MSIEVAPARTGGLRPRECGVYLLTLVPFIPSHKISVARLATSASNTQETTGGDVSERVFDDLHLWGYAAELNDDLHDFLPHVQRRASISVDDALLPAANGLRWQLTRLFMEQWDLGVNLVGFTHRLDTTYDATWTEIAAAVTSDSCKMDLARRAGELIQRAMSTGGEVPTAHRRIRTAAGRDNPMWVQQVFLVEAPSTASLPELDIAAATLTDDGAPLRLDSIADATIVRLGTAVSVVGPQGTPVSREAVGRVIRAQTAVWAAAIGLDNELSERLREVSDETARSSIELLEGRTMALLGDFERVQRFRSSVGTIAVHLHAPDRAVWKALAKEWDLLAQLESLDAKLDAVDHVYAHLTNTLAARQARTLNDVVLGVTMLSLASLCIAVWDFTQKNFDPFNWMSALVVAVSVLLSLTLFFWFRHAIQGAASGLRRRVARPRKARRAPPQPR